MINITVWLLLALSSNGTLSNVATFEKMEDCRATKTYIEGTYNYTRMMCVPAKGIFK